MNNIGPKTKQLQMLKKAGFNVPEFIALKNSDLTKSPDVLAKLVLHHLNGDSFAVRSSAFIEDTGDSSMAGQFTTRLDVKSHDLAMAITEVIEDAKVKLGSTKEFSIIVQKFIDPDFAGVTFTRNPQGGRETIVEYIEGLGDVVVAGDVKPEEITYYRNEVEVKTQIPNFKTARKTFIKIEELFGEPQDIEWAVKNKTWYILQSRPITSLRDDHEAENKFLDKILHEHKFYFEKTGVSDVAPRPTPLSYSILKKLYSKTGPVAKAYKNHGIKYQDTNFLKIIGNELFVDRELELQSLFPSHSYFHSRDYTPRAGTFKGFLTTTRNNSKLAKYRFDSKELKVKLKNKLQDPITSNNLSEALKNFLADYVTIFEISLAAEIKMRKLTKTTEMPVPELLDMKTGNPATKLWTPPAGLTGNTLEVTDTSNFQHILSSNPNTPLNEYAPADLIHEVQTLERLREYSRWLAVWHINNIYKEAQKISKTNTAFVTIDELLKGKWAESKVKHRKEEYEKYTELDLPSKLTDKMTPSNQETQGVSIGIVTGTAVDLDTMDTYSGKKILVVKNLDPSLTEYASDIEGIVSENGGLLSHFSIIAREMRLPVVVKADIKKIKLGKKITINGATGEIKKPASLN